MTKKVANFEKGLELLISKKFFFKEPDKDKFLVFSLIHLFCVLIGAILDVWFITSIFSLFFLTYIFAIKSIKHYVVISILSIALSLVGFNYFATLWTVIHLLLACSIYYLIINRYAKVTILLFLIASIFLGLAIGLSVLIKIGYITYSPLAISDFINSYISNVSKIQPDIDTDLLRASFEEIKLYFPMTLLALIFFYALIGLQYTLSSLSKEKVIVPVFPNLAMISVSSYFAWAYAVMIVLQLAFNSNNGNAYDVYHLFSINLLAVFRWVFVFNGLFTLMYFVSEHKQKGISTVFKILLFLTMYLFSGIFEIIGLLDALMGLRHLYHMSKGKGGK